MVIAVAIFWLEPKYRYQTMYKGVYCLINAVFQPPLFTDNADIASNADMNIPAACGGCNTLFSVFFYN